MKHTLNTSFHHTTGNHVPGFFIDTKNHRSSFIVLLLFILFVISIPKYDLTAIIIYAAFPLLIISAGRLPVIAILKRLVLLSPFIIIAAAANPFIDRAPFITIFNITLSSGLISGIVIILKSYITISALIAFSFCVPFYRICEILQSLRIPDVFVTQLALLYRFSSVLVTEALSMQKARDLRSFGKKGRDIFTTSKLIGALLLRTKERADRIYRGMLARGFSGTLTTRKDTPITAGEIVLIGSSLILFTCIRIIF